jgi:polysaccharide biosynthesis/export protein
VAGLRLAGTGFVCSLFVLGACSIMPTSGPSSLDVRGGQSDSESLPYALVKITPKVIDILQRNAPRFYTAFTDRRGPHEIRFGIGDIVNVTLFEAGAGGLFIPPEAGVRPGNFITLPPQAVDSKGNIFVPYAGSLRAKGRTATELQAAIVDSLKNRALDPQAIVSVVDERASSVSVLGDGVGSLRFPLSASGDRVLDAVARAGLKDPGFGLWVMLERQGRRQTIPFGALIYDSANNIYLRPQDTIYIYKQPETFLAFGAFGALGTTRQGQIPFDDWRISLAEAAAKAGGLNDIQADPGSVFVYRGETREVAELLGVDCSPFSGPIIPIIYNLNLRDPAGYFMATKFDVHNKDVIYSANASTVEITKFLNFLRTVMATANDPITYATNYYTLLNTIKGTAGVVINTPTGIH